MTIREARLLRRRDYELEMTCLGQKARLLRRRYDDLAVTPSPVIERGQSPRSNPVVFFRRCERSEAIPALEEEIASQAKLRARNDLQKSRCDSFLCHCEERSDEAVSYFSMKRGKVRLLWKRKDELAGTREKDEKASSRRQREGHRKRSGLDPGWRLPWGRTRLFTVARGTEPEPAVSGRQSSSLSPWEGYICSGSCVGAIDVAVVEGAGPLPPLPGNP